MAKIIDGRKLSNKLADELIKKVKGLKSKPKLVILQVGSLDRSNVYIKKKVQFGEKIGVPVEHKKYTEKTTLKTLVSDISKYNKDRRVHGIIVQLPLPKHLDKDKILRAISRDKDVDNYPIPATTRGVMSLLSEYKTNLKGKKVAMVGASDLVGKPTALALTREGATVTICHTKTKNIKSITKASDVIVVATGHPGLIDKSYVSPGQVIIDIGITLVNGKVVGDVDFKNVSPIVKAISPVPGGVGPMTVVSLFQNLLDSYLK